MNTAPIGHARLSPSSSSRWLACPYSAQPDLPESDNQAAQDGRDGHETAANAILHGLPLFGEWERVIVKPYVGYVLAQTAGERHHEINIQSAIIPEFGGTVDTLVVYPHAKHLHVIDLKTGKWKVPAKNNTQLKSYLALAWEIYPETVSFTGTIIQPKVYVKPNSAEFTADDMLEFRNQVAEAAESQAVNPGFHCRFCPLRSMGRCEPGADFARAQGWDEVHLNSTPERTAA